MSGRISRRDVLKIGAAIVAAGVILPGISVSSLLAADKKKKGPPRPPGTCGGWCDGDGNGSCDRSEKKDKPCNAVKCPGHVKNELRAKAKENGAPDGTCALWADKDKKGFCEQCESKKNACPYTTCPAHKKHEAKKDE